MNRRWHIINFIGVLALAGLCVWQWRRDRELNLEINRLEEVRISNAQQIREQEQQLRGLTEDLSRFREHLRAANTNLAETTRNLRAAERDNQQVATERNQLKESVAAWSEATRVRDQRLQEANERIGDLGEQLNAAIQRFNELATNYNATVRALEELRARQ